MELICKRHALLLRTPRVLMSSIAHWFGSYFE